MPKTLLTSDPGFEAAFTAFLSEKREVSVEVDNIVRDIISDVRSRGDEALIELSQRFDAVDLAKAGI